MACLNAVIFSHFAIFLQVGGLVNGKVLVVVVFALTMQVCGDGAWAKGKRPHPCYPKFNAREVDASWTELPGTYLLSDAEGVEVVLPRPGLKFTDKKGAAAALHEAWLDDDRDIVSLAYQIDSGDLLLMSAVASGWIERIVLDGVKTDSLRDSIRTTTQYNFRHEEDRERPGWVQYLYFVDWVTEPEISPDGRTLRWSIRCSDFKHAVVVYNSVELRLTRWGYLHLVTVSDSVGGIADGPMALLAGQQVSITPGYRHSDFETGDPVVDYAPSALGLAWKPVPRNEKGPNYDEPLFWVIVALIALGKAIGKYVVLMPFRLLGELLKPRK